MAGLIQAVPQANTLSVCVCPPFSVGRSTDDQESYRALLGSLGFVFKYAPIECCSAVLETRELQDEAILEAQAESSTHRGQWRDAKIEASKAAAVSCIIRQSK